MYTELTVLTIPLEPEDFSCYTPALQELMIQGFLLLGYAYCQTAYR